MGKKIIHLFCITMLIAVCFFCITVFYSCPENVLIKDKAATPFNENWKYSISNVEPLEENVNLPNKIDASKFEKVTIKNILPKEYEDGMSLCFRSSNQYVKIFVDGKKIYSFGYDSYHKFGKSPGSVWNIVRLDKGTEGGEILIETVSPYNQFSGRLSSIYLGSKTSNVFQILDNNIVGFSLCILIILLGIGLLVVFAFLKKQIRSESILYLALFAILSGLWSITGTKMLQFLVNDQNAILQLAFLCLMLLPVPLLLFVAETHALHTKKPFYFMSCAFMVNFVYSVIVQALGIVDFLEFPYFTQGLIAISMFITIFVILKEIIRYKNKDTIILGVGSCFLICVSCLDIVGFCENPAIDNSFFFRIGVLLYIIILAYHTTRQLILMVTKNFRTGMLEQLAYVDLLTNLGNRTAFEKEMEKYRIGAKGCEDLMMSIFDVNNLKLANDTFGHKEGDKLITEAANCLRSVYGDAAAIYRTGGDEFAVLSSDITLEENEELMQALDRETAMAKNNMSACLSLAKGIAVFDSETDKNVDDLYVRADALMYKEKRRMKGNLGRRKTDVVEENVFIKKAKK